MNIAIVEDQQADRQLLLEMINRYCKSHRVLYQIYQFENGESFLQENQFFDLVILDIYMNGMDGMQTAERLRKKNPDSLLVFSTTSDQFAVKSYRVRAFDYLVKPYTYEEFREVMALCDKALKKNSHYIQVKEGRYLVKILLNEIIYTDYFNHYIQIHTKKRMIRTYISFQDFSAMLLTFPQFMFCYRNCIVNMDEVAKIDERDFVMKNGERVPIAQKKQMEIKQRFADYEFDKMERGR